MAHWVETYPHTVYASVLLLDDKIMNWKVGERKWKHNMDMTRRINRPFSLDDYVGEMVESIGFEANNSEEHNHAFEVLAPEWFKQWEIDESLGNPPYKIKPNYWDIARLLLPHSNCLKRHYACVIVKDGNIIATGYNASLNGCTTCAREDIEHNVGDYAECRSVHAEQLALIHADNWELNESELYLVCDKDVDPTPCPTCQKMLTWCGVTLNRESDG